MAAASVNFGAHSNDIETLRSRLRAIVGPRHVLVAPRKQRPFVRGYRYGDGIVNAVVRPGSLLELWLVFKLCVEFEQIIIMQAANTGLNGGSTPFGEGYDRGIVLISGMRVDRIDFLGGCRQALCFPGSRLRSLEQLLAPVGREPHSVLGSTSIGATVVGGISNNSGGALLRRGPAYTQLALYARINERGEAELVNELGIRLGDSAEEILSRLDNKDYRDDDIMWDDGRLASDPDYARIVSEIDKDTPARFNNDPRLLFGASGAAGKVCTFAVRVDTFEKATGDSVFCLGSDNYTVLTDLRRYLLTTFSSLPIACEYLSRDGHHFAAKYGKDVYAYLKYIGAKRISIALDAKRWLDGITEKLGIGTAISDRILQFLSDMTPAHLPARIAELCGRYEHHLLLRIEKDTAAELRGHLKGLRASSSLGFFECTPHEAAAAFRHRYVLGAAAVRYRAVHADSVENLVALDVAFPRNTQDWRDNIPTALKRDLVARFPCGHFLCHTFHYDYAVRKGADWLEVERGLVRHFAELGAEVPSEHNVGHMYVAKDALVRHYRSLDPTNSMNPGIGGASKKRNWA